MAFTAAVTTKTTFGNKRYHYGTYTNTGGSTGGDIDTGLNTCEFFQMQPGGASGLALNPALNETLPVAGNAITIVNNANETGYWFAFGT